MNIYARVGFEIGRVLRILAENDIQWGYYWDHDPGVRHQNAHPNNLLVVPEFLNSECLLAPIDFDLAFSREEFINIDFNLESYGKRDDTLFDSYLEQSRYGLEDLLQGNEASMSNFNF